MNDKIYSPAEVAVKVLDKTKELCKQYKENLEKSAACEVNKYGEMKMAKNNKLKEFIEKRKAKKSAKIEKMLGVGEQQPNKANMPAMPAAGEQNKPIAEQFGSPNAKK